MEHIEFLWDEIKDEINQRKHGVSFEEAKTVFADDFARIIPDPDSSQEEERFILMGLSNKVRVILVCHCYRGENETIRIISARKADKQEIKQYRDFRHA